MIITNPNQPWTQIDIVGLIVAVLLPFMFFPFSRTLWLPWDLPSRPSERGDVGGNVHVNAPQFHATSRR